MSYYFSRKFTARMLFIFGLLLMLAGSTFLLGTIPGTSRIAVLISFISVVAGVSCAVFAIRLNMRSLYLFFAGFFLMVGFFLFLSALNVFPMPFTQAWPLLSIFSGMALLPAGLHKHSAFRSRFVVPSIGFVVLGSILFVFSLRVVSVPLKQFVKEWWPLLGVASGIVLVLISLAARNTSSAR
ncbi:LiaI-LiaF-like domain-containing protein [Breznakiellaceae bacterium SP9]